MILIRCRCKHADGSFSAFGDRDVHGSTWLTAFVAHCFSYARDLKKELIQKSVIDNATRFLLGQQKEDGSFEEKGQVICQDLQVQNLNNILSMFVQTMNWHLQPQQGSPTF